MRDNSNAELQAEPGAGGRPRKVLDFRTFRRVGKGILRHIKRIFNASVCKPGHENNKRLKGYDNISYMGAYII